MSSYEFVFVPIKLKIQRESIDMKMRNKIGSIINQAVDSRNLQDYIINVINNTPFGELDNLAYSLKVKELFTVVVLFSNGNKQINRRKAYQIINARFKKSYAKLIWNELQRYYMDKVYVNYTYMLYDNHKALFLADGLTDERAKLLKSILLDADPLRASLKYIERKRITIRKFLGMFNFDYNLNFGSDLRKYAYANCSVILYSQEDEEDIVEILDKYDNTGLMAFVENYIGIVPYESLKEKIMYKINDLKGKPIDTNRDMFWSGVSGKVKDKYRRWFLEKALKQNFDKRRFYFWMGFIDYMEDVKVVEAKKQMFLYFPKFVAVEFGECGAVYIYDRNFFDEHMGMYTDIIYRSDSFFKDQERCIKRLEHRKKYWENKFHDEIMDLLR